MNRKVLLIVDLILLVITVICYKIIFDIETNKTIYAEETTRFVEENENPIFRIEKIVLWSSAHAVDNSEGELKDIDISQFTDIEIYIDNMSRINELTFENTVSDMFIDGIEIDTNEVNRDVRFNYKNPTECGKFSDISNWIEDGIQFNIVNTNKEQRESDFKDNLFFTDCSNPITLGYLNKDFMTHCEIGGESGVISFDGSILSKISQDINVLNSKITFTVHIVNNYGEKFFCKVPINIDLTENDNAIDSGFLKTEIIPKDNTMIFIREGNQD